MKHFTEISAILREYLRSMLKLGRSKPWKEALKAMTGSEDMTADAIVKYFAPLKKWLEDYNKAHNISVGWD